MPERIALLALLSASALQAEGPTIRVATFNITFSPDGPAALVDGLADPVSAIGENARDAAEIIQKVAPDVILLNEFNHDPDDAAIQSFQELYLGVGQNGQDPIAFPFRFVAPVNTGVHSGHDLDNRNGIAGTPGSQAYANDAFGFGRFPGQFGMIVLSKFPVDTKGARSFQTFLWQDMPANLLPIPYYDKAERADFRLSSKSHWDVPVQVGDHTFHLLASHPTPPVFDGAEDRNGRRNHDEIRLWADYVTPGRGGYIYDDSGVFGGLSRNERFVLVGDQNADPDGGDTIPGAIAQLLDNPRVNSSFVPMGAATDDTANFSGGSNRLRVDYVLPSTTGFAPLDGAVFWPLFSDPDGQLVTFTDHRMVWMDLQLLPVIESAVANLQIDANGDDVVIRWTSQADVVYTVERSTDLGADSWSAEPDIPIDINPANNSATATDAGALRRERRTYYRVTAAFAEVPSVE